MSSQISNAHPLRLPTEDRKSTDDDLVERDANGNYMLAAPNNGVSKIGSFTAEVDEETGECSPRPRFRDRLCSMNLMPTPICVEQDNQLIAMYGKRNEHWDTAGNAPLSTGFYPWKLIISISGLTEEIKAALKRSMEKKVQSLETDKWMFEGEGRPKG
jgi:hypothetical protein